MRSGASAVALKDSNVSLCAGNIVVLVTVYQTIATMCGVMLFQLMVHIIALPSPMATQPGQLI